MPDRILIRADGSVRTGAGHFMRCLAFAQEWKRTGGQADFAQAETTPALRERLVREEIELHVVTAKAGSQADAESTIALARKLGVRWIVADGYEFGAQFQSLLKQADLRLLLLDDYGHADFYEADFVINQNLGASAAIYQRKGPQVQLLLGTKYVLLRREFRKWRHRLSQVSPEARHVLVTLGGSDPGNLSGRWIQAFSSLPDVSITVIVGGSNPHRVALKQLVSEANASGIKLVEDPEDFSEELSRSDVAIAAGGTTAWELAFMGIPSLLVVVADNQRNNVRELAAAGVAISCGDAAEINFEELRGTLESLLKDFPRRREMSRRGKTLVDGLGAERLAAHLRAAELKLERARLEDSETIREWANDPQTRGASFSAAPISKADHSLWFARKLSDQNCYYYLAKNGSSELVGQIRFDLQEKAGLISFGLNPSARGRGLGSALLLHAVTRFFSDSPAGSVHGYVKVDNKASIRAFLVANFIETGCEVIDGQEAVRFVFDRK